VDAPGSKTAPRATKPLWGLGILNTFPKVFEANYYEKISAAAYLIGVKLDPTEITRLLGLRPTSLVAGTWCFETNPGAAPSDILAHPSCTSGDVNEHLRLLLRLFKPLKPSIELLVPRPTLVVQVKWESNVRSTESPEIEPDCLSDLGEIGAKLSFKWELARSAHLQMPER
jgi:hypothetical protein